MRKLKFSKSSIRNMGGIREEIKQLAHRVMSKSIHDFGIPRDGGKRTAKRQNVLYKLVPRVTWLDGYMKKSYHQSGEALDIFIYDQHGACWALALHFPFSRLKSAELTNLNKCSSYV